MVFFFIFFLLFLYFFAFFAKINPASCGGWILNKRFNPVLPTEEYQ